MLVVVIWCGLSVVWLKHAQSVCIKGVGGSFSAEVYQRIGPAFEEHRKKFVDINYTYVVESSMLEKMPMLEGDTSITFTVLESSVKRSEILNKNIKLFPVLAGAVGLAYNLPGISNLVLTREVIVGIYNGTIRKWNDPEISKRNPDTVLPQEYIRPVARADVAGATDIFTSTLSVISPEWEKKYGTFYEGLVEGTEEPKYWNSSVIRYYGRTDKGMIGLIISYSYSIGYVSFNNIVSGSWTYARIVNKAGNIVSIDAESVRQATKSFFRNISRGSITYGLPDSRLSGAYPIMGLSYLHLHTRGGQSCEVARELYFLVEWLLRNEEADRIIGGLYYGVVEKDVADFVLSEILSTTYCRAGLSLAKVVEERRRYERWLGKLPRMISFYSGLTSGLVLLLATIAYFLRKQIQLKRSLWAGDWRIEAADVHIRWDRDRGWTNGDLVSRLSDLGSSATGGVSASAFSQNVSLFTEKYARWKGRTVCLRKFPHRDFRIKRKRTKKAIVIMKSKLIHANVLRFHGVCLMDDRLYMVSDHAEKGSLTDVLQNTGYKLDDNLKYALALDIATGMHFLHSNGIVHGMLISDCCLLDSRWNVTITNWEVIHLYGQEEDMLASRFQSLVAMSGQETNLHACLGMWTAPELLRAEMLVPNKKSDVYSFAIILVEIFTRRDPYWELSEKMEPAEVTATIVNDRLRPDISTITCNKIKPIITSAWHEKPDHRPSFSTFIRKLKRCRKSRKPVIESMMATLELYVNNLEDIVHERTTELAAVNKSLENLLYQILPPSVARRLSNGQTVEPEHFSSATIFFSDIVGFTAICAASTPIQVVNLLNDLYTMFDSVIDSLDVYKVETIGDAYMCISGVPIRNGVRHVVNIADMALSFMKIVKSFKIRHMPDNKLELRAGIHTGAVVAGVVGIKMPRYCLFGDTVNTASRMESTSLPMHIQVTTYTYTLLDGFDQYEFKKRGNIHVKGKGEMITYFLLGTTRPLSESPSVCDYLAKIQPFPSFRNNSTLMNDSPEEGNRKRRVKKKVSFLFDREEKPPKRGILK